MGTDLVDLVGALVRIPGEFRVRIGMMNPGSASGIWQRLLDVYARSKVYRFLHLPVQSGSERILARMGRDHDLPAYLNMVREFRRRYDEPDSLLSTDIIVGFPGESEKDMCSSMELIRESAPDIVNVTRFSSRPGTPASRYPDRPSGAEVKARSRALTRLRFEVSARRNARLVGRVMDVLVTGCGRHGWRCRSDSYRPVVVPGDGLAPGERVRVRITGSGRTHLVGMPVR